MLTGDSNADGGIPTPEAPDDEAYTVLSKSSKAWITLLVGVSGFFSPLSANIYFPAITHISEDLHVSIQLINFTITAYLICQCITPSITGDLADMVGRRPVYLLVLTIYFGANLGLSLQKTYAGLLVLRMIQSMGASGTIALCLSVIHDIAAPHERGKYMGAAMTGSVHNLPSVFWYLTKWADQTQPLALVLYLEAYWLRKPGGNGYFAFSPFFQDSTLFS